MRVLITRPAHQAQGLCKTLTDHSHEPWLFPCLEIEPLPDHRSRQLITSLAHADYAIVLSSNAVQAVSDAISPDKNTFSPGLKWIAIGPGSQASLLNLGISCEVPPHQHYSSEGLLLHPELQDIKQKTIVIFRGEGGRELISEELTKRKATVVEIITYRRKLPCTNTQELISQLKAGKIDLISVTSNEILRNLILLIGDNYKSILHNIPIIVVSDRTLKFAKCYDLGTTLIKANNATPHEILTAINEYSRLISNQC